MPTLETNPFSILTFIAAPALLTNASSVMTMGTSNRFARVVDRTRSLAASIKTAAKEESPFYLRMLDRNVHRGELLVSALRAYYCSLGCFATATLVSLLGAIAASLEVPYGLRASLGVALIAGIGGVSGLVYGCTLLVRETRLAQANLREESERVRAMAVQKSGPTELTARVAG